MNRASSRNLDEQAHLAFDASIHISHSSSTNQCLSLSSNVLRRCLLSLRTAYSASISLVIVNYLQLAGRFSYLCGVISIISTTVYFGQWQSSVLHAIYAVCISLVLGLCVGYFYLIPVIQIILYFLLSIWLNRNSGFNQSSKVLSCVTLTLATFTPTILKEYNPIEIIQFVFGGILFPYFITGFTLLFPIPALAINNAKLRTTKLCRDLSSLTIVLMREFILQDLHELYISEFAFLQQHIQEDLEFLTMLLNHSSYEVCFFTNLNKDYHILVRFLQICQLIFKELIGLQNALNTIPNNYTQARFVETMSTSLDDIACEINICLRLMSEYLQELNPRWTLDKVASRKQLDFNLSKGFQSTDSIEFDPNRLFQSSKLWINSHHQTEGALPVIDKSFFWDSSKVLITTRLEELASRKVELTQAYRTYSIDGSFDDLIIESFERLCIASETMRSSYMTTRIDFLWNRPQELLQVKEEEAHEEVLEGTAEEHCLPLLSRQSFRREASISNISKEEREMIVKENHSIRNLNSRGAYVHRVMQLVSHFEDFVDISKTSSQVFSLQDFLIRLSVYISSYIFQVLGFIYTFFIEVTQRLRSCRLIQEDDDIYLKKMWLVYLSPIKIALSMAITSLVIVIPNKFFNNIEMNGIWTVIVISFIRSESSSNSFLTGIQRIEGMFLNALFNDTLTQ